MAPALDAMAQIRVFAKLKLTSCARPGNRAGLLLDARGTIQMTCRL